MIDSSAETVDTEIPSAELTEVIFPMNKSNTVSRDFRWLPADLIFLMRPTQYLPIWATLFAGFVVISLKNNQAVFNSIQPSTTFWFIFLGVSLVSGAVFAFNQISDIESDRLNGKLLILPKKLVSVAEAKWFGNSIIAIALLIGIFTSIPVFSIFAICGLLGFLYNSNPFNWKNNPYLSILINYLGGGLCFIAGGLTVEPFSLNLILGGLPYALSWAAVFSLVTIPDIYGDHKSGKRTIAITVGIEKTKWIATFAVVLSLLASLILKDYIFLISAGLAFPLYLRILNNESAGVFTPVKFSFIFLTLVPIYFSPLFILPVALNVVLCKLYYKFRFGIDYPNFSSNK